MSKIQKTLNDKLEFYIYNNLMINDINLTISITIESLIRAIKKYHDEHQYHVEYKEVKNIIKQIINQG